jgi:DNA-binding MarR family transcriptional regulator
MNGVAYCTTQYGILAKLKRQGPMSINTLAAELVVDRTTLGRNIRPLERDDLIAIEADPSDRRSKVLRLTKAGDARFQRAEKRWAEAQRRFENTYVASEPRSCARACAPSLRVISARSTPSRPNRNGSNQSERSSRWQSFGRVREPAFWLHRR